MPGHIIDAKCPCGYQRELMPGAGGFGDKNYVMAYSPDFKHIGTYEKKKAELEEMKMIQDPFLEAFEFDEGEIENNNREAPQTTIFCPKCKKDSLHLSIIGLWD